MPTGVDSISKDIVLMSTVDDFGPADVNLTAKIAVFRSLNFNFDVFSHEFDVFGRRLDVSCCPFDVSGCRFGGQ